MRNDDPRLPRFRTYGPKGREKVVLQCSACQVDIRELKPQESIQVDRGHYCKKCDTGTVIFNPPK